MDQNDQNAKEHLLSLKLSGGQSLDFTRAEDKSLHITQDDGHELVIPKATGRQTLDLLGLLTQFGEIEEEEEE